MSMWWSKNVLCVSKYANVWLRTYQFASHSIKATAIERYKIRCVHEPDLAQVHPLRMALKY